MLFIMRMKLCGLVFILALLPGRGYSQQKIAIRLDAIYAGASWLETEFRYADFPFHFERYLDDKASFPSMAFNSYYSRDAVQQDWIWQLDTDWRLQKAGLQKFWQYARFQTGAIYSAQTIPGQSVGTQNEVLVPGGFQRTVELYSNDMRFSLLGLQFGWKQFWHPFGKAPSLELYTGFSWVNAWALHNDITQSRYFQEAVSTAAEGYKVTNESTETEPDLAGKNFRWQRWQLPLGIAYRVNRHLAMAAEFNAGLYRHVVDEQRGKYEEAHGFSARIGYYF